MKEKSLAQGHNTVPSSMIIYAYYRQAEHDFSSSSFTYRAAYFISELSVTEVKQVDANKVGIKLTI